MERFDHSVKFHTWYEHWHRYHFLKDLVSNAHVCDIACGEGYGSALLASSAKSVVGVDIDDHTVSAARKTYQRKNLTYQCFNAIKTGFEDNSFDFVVSFETLEHLYEQNELLIEFRRILKPNGILIISTPDKDVYSEADAGHNHFHVKELDRSEFDTLVSDHFNYSKTFGQQFQLMSIIENEDKKKTSYDGSVQYVDSKNGAQRTNNISRAEYLIKFCANEQTALDDLKVSDFNAFSDSINSLFKHYKKQTDRLMESDKNHQQLMDTINKQTALIQHLKARLGI